MIEVQERALTIQLPEKLEPILQPSRYKALYGGRGGTKSHAFARLAIIRCLAGTTRLVCVREIQNSIEQSVKRLLEDVIKLYNLEDQFNIQDREIHAPYGGVIIFRGMQNSTAEQMKSLEGYDIAWVEEAQTISDDSLTLLRPTIRKPGSELWFSWNPREENDPVDVFFRGPKGPPPNSIVIETSYRDNPWISDELLAEMKLDRENNPDKYTHVWLGGYKKINLARVFSNWQVSDVVVPSGHEVFYFGADWGFAESPTAGHRSWMEDDRTLVVDSDVWKIGCEIDDTPDLLDQLGCFERHFDDVPCKGPDHGQARKYDLVADSARPETISYMKRHGYPKMKPSRKGPGSVEEGIKFLQNYRIKISSQCVRTIEEFTFYSYKIDPKTGKILPVLVQKKNHVIDSLRYMAEDLRAPGKSKVRVYSA